MAIYKNGQAKQFCRDEMLEVCLGLPDWRRPRNVLTLPADALVFEKALATKRPSWRLTGAENDPATLASALKRARRLELQIAMTGINVDEYDTSREDIVWFDWCGPITPARLDALKRASGACEVVAFTFLRARDGFSSDISRLAAIDKAMKGMYKAAQFCYNSRHGESVSSPMIFAIYTKEDLFETEERRLQFSRGQVIDLDLAG